MFPLQNDLMNQYENLNCSLDGAVPSGLQAFVLSLNSTLNMYTLDESNGMHYFMMGMYGDLQGPARDARRAFQSSLQQILSYVSKPNSTTNEMVSDACVVTLFQEMRNIFEPMVNDIITSGNNLLKLIPGFRDQLSSLVNDAKLEVEAVTKKLNYCNKIQEFDDKITCAANLVRKYFADSPE